MKERLTGAIILVALLVLLVPELLTGPSPKAGVKSAAENEGPLRSYTIDLADDPATGRPSAAAPVATGPTAVTDEPVAQAKVEESGEGAGAAPDAGQNDGRDAGVSEQREGGQAAAGGASPAAGGAAVQSEAALAEGEQTARTASATNEPGTAERGSPASRTAESGAPAAQGSSSGGGSAASPAPDQPRSAFGPNAARAASGAGSSSRGGSTEKPASATGDASRAGAASSTKPAVAAPPPARAATTQAPPSKGWAVQLGVFASRDNAERLAKQVKGKGYPVIVNETSGTKHLYRVRVGPEKDRAAADALNARLRAAGHAGAVVPLP